MSENAQSRPNLLELFRSYKDTVTGIVERCGVHLADDNTVGYSVLLQGDTFSYTLHRGDQPGFHYIGLTLPGDEVEFEADGYRKVLLHEFNNITLRERCPALSVDDRVREAR